MSEQSASAQALEYLQVHTVMSIATTGQDGPWNTAVFYVNDGYRLYFVSAPESRHSRNITGNPLVAITIQENYRDWREIQGIQGQGSVRVLAGEEREHAIALYLDKFSFLQDQSPGPGVELVLDALDHAAWYGFTPQSLYFLDNARGFAHREEIPL